MQTPCSQLLICNWAYRKASAFSTNRKVKSIPYGKSDSEERLTLYQNEVDDKFIKGAFI